MKLRLIELIILSVLNLSSLSTAAIPEHTQPLAKITPLALKITPVIHPLQIKVSAVVVPSPRPAYTPVTTNGATINCGDNTYAHFIYMHESGCRTNAIGPNGPCGLGQALPCSKLPCSLSDYKCQNNWFNNYAQKYGGWAGAYTYWVAHNYW